jgi:hypothetical protein
MVSSPSPKEMASSLSKFNHTTKEKIKFFRNIREKLIEAFGIGAQLREGESRKERGEKFRRGADLRTLAEILGYMTMSMVMGYTHLLDEHKKKAIQLLDGLGF